jgi:hypothetical protein
MLAMKDTLVVFMTTRRCRDAQYRVDKAFSRILGLCRGRKEKNDDGVKEK